MKATPWVVTGYGKWQAQCSRCIYTHPLHRFQAVTEACSLRAWLLLHKQECGLWYDNSNNNSLPHNSFLFLLSIGVEVVLMTIFLGVFGFSLRDLAWRCIHTSLRKTWLQKLCCGSQERLQCQNKTKETHPHLYLSVWLKISTLFQTFTFLS